MITDISIDNVIIGSGPSGVAAAYYLSKNNTSTNFCKVFEKDSTWGGLCGYFEIDGFRFDRFVHFTFADNAETKDLFESSSPTVAHLPKCSNYYHGYWVRHPAQNNLYPLPVSEKVAIIDAFINRPKLEEGATILNYEEWLRLQYGDYFAEHFPFIYTKKYWGVQPCELETKWVGVRMYCPDLKEVLRGAMEVVKDNFYYTKLMNYPKHGGYRSILNKCYDAINLECNKEVVKILPNEHKVCFKDGSFVTYKHLISSMPLPEIVKVLPDVPENVKSASSKLRCTCGYQVSLGFKRPDIAKHLWFYIYDEDVLAARVYSPNLKSPDNVPKGCSALQAEVFYGSLDEVQEPKLVLNNTIEKLKTICNFTDDDIVVKDIRFEKYANVIFTHDIYENRQIVLDYLKSLGIGSIGRFGKWEYLWSHQAFEDGKNYALSCMQEE